MPLKSVREFNSFYKTSKTYHTKFFVLFFQSDKQKRFSVVASKKVGKAFQRNFAKRRLRALFVEFSDRLDDSLILVAKRDILSADFKELKYLFNKALKRVS